MSKSQNPSNNKNITAKARKFVKPTSARSGSGGAGGHYCATTGRLTLKRSVLEEAVDRTVWVLVEQSETPTAVVCLSKPAEAELEYAMERKVHAKQCFVNIPASVCGWSTGEVAIDYEA